MSVLPIRSKTLTVCIRSYGARNWLPKAREWRQWQLFWVGVHERGNRWWKEVTTMKRVRVQAERNWPGLNWPKLGQIWPGMAGSGQGWVTPAWIGSHQPGASWLAWPLVGLARASWCVDGLVRCALHVTMGELGSHSTGLGWCWLHRSAWFWLRSRSAVVQPGQKRSTTTMAGRWVLDRWRKWKDKREIGERGKGKKILWFRIFGLVRKLWNLWWLSRQKL